MLDIDRLPPQAEEIEVHILGAMCLDRDAADTALVMLRAEDFYKGSHQKIFQVAGEVYEREQTLDQSLLREELRERGLLEEVGGVGYLAELVGSVPTTAHMDQYASLVKERAKLRSLITVGVDLVRASYEPGAESYLVAERAFNQLLAADEEANGQADTSISAVLGQSMQELENGCPGLPTGMHHLDTRLGGIAAQELVIIAAEVSQGKSTFAVGLMREWAKRGVPCYFGSYEMSGPAIGRILIASEAHTCIRKDGTYPGERNQPVEDAITRLNELPMFIDDRPPPLGALPALFRRYYRKNGCRAFFVDYLQLIPSAEGDTREQQVAAISRTLKATARDLKVPVVALSQFNRTVDGEPKLKQLRESGAIEQDADVVLMLWSKATDSPEHGNVTREVHCKIAKNRSGETGTEKLLWQRGYRYFEDGGRSWAKDTETDEIPF